MRKFEELSQELRREPRTWLVTGVAGFVGSHLLEALLLLGQRVRGLDNFVTGKRDNLDDVRRRVGDAAWERFDLVTGDIRNEAACRSASEGVRHVLHQAALGSVPRSLEDPRTTHDVNVTGFVNVLLAARDAAVESLVYASSSSVYGDSPDLPKREDRIGAPLSPYAASKHANEVYANAYARSFGLALVGLRYFNVVGARQDPNGPYAAVVPRWLASLAVGEAPVIYGDGMTSRDFSPVANVVQANLLAATCGARSEARVYNIALGQRTTLNELFVILRDGMASHGISCADLTARYEGFRPGDVRHSQADISRAVTELGYDPEVGLEEGLALAVEAAASVAKA